MRLIFEQAGNDIADAIDQHKANLMIGIILFDEKFCQIMFNACSLAVAIQIIGSRAVVGDKYDFFFIIVDTRQAADVICWLAANQKQQ